MAIQIATLDTLTAVDVENDYLIIADVSETPDVLKKVAPRSLFTGSKVSELDAIETIAGADELYINDDGVSKKITIDQLVAYLEGVIDLPTPDTPTAPVTDDEADTFAFTQSDGYTDWSDYEYRINGGSWTAMSASTVDVGDIAIDAGALEVRVKAVPAANKASGILTNDVAFTVAEGGGGGEGVSWNHGVGFTSDGGDITPTTSGSYEVFATTNESIDSEGGADTYFTITIPAGSANYIHGFIAPASGGPYSANPNAAGAFFDSYTSVREWGGASYAPWSADVTVIATGIKVGFTAAGNLQVWNAANDAVIWTSSGTYTGDYVFVYKRASETGVTTKVLSADIYP